MRSTQLPRLALERLGLAPWTSGSPKVVPYAALNAFGLQVARILGAHGLHRLRSRGPASSPEGAALRRDGLVLIPDFLPSEIFEEVLSEFHKGMGLLAQCQLARAGEHRNYARFEDSTGTFGRLEFGEVNLEYVVVPVEGEILFPTIRREVLQSPRVLSLISEVSGMASVESRTGELHRISPTTQLGRPDPERALHQDTFCHDWKVWLTIGPMSATNAAFSYARGTHRLTPRRLVREYWKSVAKLREGGSWRGTPHALGHRDSRVESICCEPNTLIVADTYGLHARGSFRAFGLREAIHITFRLNPWTLG